MTIEKRILKQYQKRAQAMKDDGWTIDDSDMFEMLTVQSPVDHDYYQFNYDERDKMKADQPDWLDMEFEDYVLALATNW